jgi:hypothetical protein
MGRSVTTSAHPRLTWICRVGQGARAPRVMRAMQEARGESHGPLQQVWRGRPASPGYIALPWLRPTTWPSGSANIASHVSGAGLNFGITTVPPSAWTFANVASRSGTLT